MNEFKSSPASHVWSQKGYSVSLGGKMEKNDFHKKLLSKSLGMNYIFLPSIYSLLWYDIDPQNG